MNRPLLTPEKDRLLFMFEIERMNTHAAVIRMNNETRAYLQRWRDGWRWNDGAQEQGPWPTIDEALESVLIDVFANITCTEGLGRKVNLGDNPAFFEQAPEHKERKRDVQ